MTREGDFDRVENHFRIGRALFGLGALQLGGLLHVPSLLHGAEDRADLEQTTRC